MLIGKESDEMKRSNISADELKQALDWLLSIKVNTKNQYYEIKTAYKALCWIYKNDLSMDYKKYNLFNSIFRWRDTNRL